METQESSTQETITPLVQPSATPTTTQTFRILALYKFVSPKIPAESLKDLQSEIETTCRKYKARGTLLIAEEGINGTICYPFNKSNRPSGPTTPPAHENGSDNRVSARNNSLGQEEAFAENCHQDQIKAGRDSEDDPLLEFLQSKFDHSLRVRVSYVTSADHVFSRLKIKIKSEIVTMRQDDACPIDRVGTYVKPKDWNNLLLDPDCMVIDTRNEYEVQLGTFRNAINPHTQNFTEFPDWMKQNLIANDYDGHDDNPTSSEVQVARTNVTSQEAVDSKVQAGREVPPKKIAMFCTGGIRCEKATSAAVQLVPDNIPVYHLEGGILAYLDAIPQDKSLFDGECYVFDQRIAVTHGLHPSTQYKYSCHACRHPLSVQDLERNDYLKGMSCRHCVHKLTEKQKLRFASRQHQIELASQLGKVHIHDPKEHMIR